MLQQLSASSGADETTVRSEAANLVIQAASGDQAACHTESSCPCRVFVRSVTSQMARVRSREAVATCSPSGDQAMAYSVSLCPFSQISASA